MGTFGTFLLMVFAFSATVVFFVNPLKKLAKVFEGKRGSDLEAAVQKWQQKLEESEDKEAVSMLVDAAFKIGCYTISIISLLAFSLVITFVVEPVYIVIALTKGIGHPIAAYVVGLITLASWVTWISLPFKMAAAVRGKKTTITTAEGVAVTGTVVDEKDEPIDFSISLWQKLLRWVFFLPDIYLWYILLISLDILPNWG